MKNVDLANKLATKSKLTQKDVDVLNVKIKKSATKRFLN